MSGRISAIVLTLLWLHSPIVFGQAHFKRFTETVTNNGAYVLGWGLKDDPAGSVDSKTEIVADGPEKIDIESIGVDVETFERIEDYLVDTATGKIVATIPDFTYYAGSEGRENHFHLEVGWSPDNRGGIAIYQARYATDKVAWINPTEHKTSNVWPQIEKAAQAHQRSLRTNPNSNKTRTMESNRRIGTRPLTMRRSQPLAGAVNSSQHIYEVRPRSDKRDVDLISDTPPFGRLWYDEPDAIGNAIGYAQFRSR